ncbi:MAG: hypothetical protein JRH20_21675, partial [Deltaproteobacteria bacterium]|nr:hypothetical protein [Deltaproteobacteria bacterium]
MNSSRWNIIGATLLLSASTFISCTATTPPPSYPKRGADCPERPDAMSRIEQLEELGRGAREARANLITQWPEQEAPEQGERPKQKGPRIVATLHDPYLALIEAILQTPRRALRPDKAWLANHLLRSSIELRSTKPLAVLERGDRRALRLLTESGSRLPILLITHQRDGESWTYRLTYDPPRMKEALMRLTLSLPLEPKKGQAIFRWALSPRNLRRLDRLPIAYGLSWLRDLVWARKAALFGDLGHARTLVERTRSCEPELGADPLLQALQGERQGPSAVFDFGVSDEPGSTTLPAAQALALRGAILARLAPAARRGLIPTPSYEALQKQLRDAAAQLSAKSLLAFDTMLARALVKALSPHGTLAAAAPQLVALKPSSA